MVYLTNEFSLNMVARSLTLDIVPLTLDGAKGFLTTNGAWTSAVGHADTAAILAGLLGVPVPCNRVNVALLAGDYLIVAQYVGPRLPEGATTLPEGARIDWFYVARR